MKLSKNNQARQRAIRKAIASGKSVGGLLAGVLALATAGCSPKGNPGPIGRFPDPSYDERAGRNAGNEGPQQVTTGETQPPAAPKTPGKAPSSRPDKSNRSSCTTGLLPRTSPTKAGE